MNDVAILVGFAEYAQITGADRSASRFGQGVRFRAVCREEYWAPT